MNRPIKFRAWENNLKEIIAVEEIEFLTRMINQSSAWRVFDEVELMQFTGLKDKNGTEIYEGDIIAQHIKNDEYMNIKEVKFGCFEDSVDYFVYNGVGFYAVGNDIEENGGLPYMIEFADYEVIGNIYEHPELWERDGE